MAKTENATIMTLNRPPYSQYIQYNKLKRIIKRLKFEAESKSNKAKTLEKVKAGIDVQGEASVELVRRLSMAVDENTPLTLMTKEGRTESYTENASKHSADDDKEEGDFFDTILDEMRKSNNFFVGKQCELRIALETMTNARSNAYVTHHTSTDPNFLSKLREIYVELKNLINYSELSQAGFYKIIKKYDKSLGTNTLSVWQTTIDRQPFTLVAEANQLMEVVTGLVSRDKLVEWDRLENEKQNKSKDDIFSSVRVPGLVAAVVIFLVSYYFPFIAADDPCAQRCMSLLLLTLCLWITEAIPYYATGILVPIFVTVLGSHHFSISFFNTHR